MRRVILIFSLLPLLTTASPPPPDEALIYYHLHQTTRWAELIYSKNCQFSKKSMEKHLAKIKYSQMRLVDSRFYKDYIFLRQIAFGEKTASLGEVEGLRFQIHEKAEKLKLKHPENWQTEFLICTDRF